MNKYPTVNPFHRKEIDKVLKTLEAIKHYNNSLSVELMKKYIKFYINETEKIRRSIWNN
jgi:predicted nucleotidyltransferase